jgi:hypothetical protein
VLIAVAEAHDCVVVLRCAVGDFVTPGAVLVEVEGSGWPPAPQLHRLFAFGRERTIEQNSAFALRILVDVAIKGLLSLRTRYALRGCDEKTRAGAAQRPAGSRWPNDPSGTVVSPTRQLDGFGGRNGDRRGP